MSMSILDLEEKPRPPALPTLSTKHLFALVALGLCVFGATVIALMQVMPKRREIDLMVMGTIAVVVAMVVIFVALKVMRRKLFVPPDEDALA